MYDFEWIKSQQKQMFKVMICCAPSVQLDINVGSQIYV